MFFQTNYLEYFRFDFLWMFRMLELWQMSQKVFESFSHFLISFSTNLILLFWLIIDGFLKFQREEFSICWEFLQYFLILFKMKYKGFWKYYDITLLSIQNTITNRYYFSRFTSSNQVFKQFFSSIQFLIFFCGAF